MTQITPKKKLHFPQKQKNGSKIAISAKKKLVKTAFSAKVGEWVKNCNFHKKKREEEEEEEEHETVESDHVANSMISNEN